MAFACQPVASNLVLGEAEFIEGYAIDNDIHPIWHPDRFRVGSIDEQSKG